MNIEVSFKRGEILSTRTKAIVLSPLLSEKHFPDTSIVKDTIVFSYVEKHTILHLPEIVSGPILMRAIFWINMIGVDAFSLDLSGSTMDLKELTEALTGLSEELYQRIEKTFIDQPWLIREKIREAFCPFNRPMKMEVYNGLL
jgi:hypothetical protein